MGESYYDLLGIDTDASRETIEQAYRDRLKETHPDVSDAKNASERTKRIIEAKDVLTDEEKRARYDRLGHDAYVGVEGSAVDSTAEPSESSTAGSETAAQSGDSADSDSAGASATASGWKTESTGTDRASRRSGRGRHVRNNRKTVSGSTAEESWYGGNDDPGWEKTDDNWRAWNTDGSFAVDRGSDRYKGRMLTSQRSLILLTSTFFVYPVLLFGALLPEFPLGVNLSVALCVILVIAFLQSIPEVGIAVFGIWTMLLPLTLIWFNIALLSIPALLAMLGVLFPFFLSILTKIAIRPLSPG